MQSSQATGKVGGKVGGYEQLNPRVIKQGNPLTRSNHPMIVQQSERLRLWSEIWPVTMSALQVREGAIGSTPRFQVA